MYPARFYKKLQNQKVKCNLCEHQCIISKGKVGLCGVRKNMLGKLYSLNYGQLIAMNIDPIEKKPLYHFLPGTKTFSIACVGCNFRCSFCQNWRISQTKEFQKNKGLAAIPDTPVQKVVFKALENNCPSISYTYTEPTVFMEYALDTAKIAKQYGLKNIFVTNGYQTTQALEIMSKYIDAANVDLKFFNNEKYIKQCGGSLEPVKRNISMMKNLDIWVEVTTLIIPGLNDSEQEIADMAEFLFNIDPDIVWHLSAFHPDYKMKDRKSTSVSVIKKAMKIANQVGLKRVYPGNVSSPAFNDDS